MALLSAKSPLEQKNDILKSLKQKSSSSNPKPLLPWLQKDLDADFAEKLIKSIHDLTLITNLLQEKNILPQWQSKLHEQREHLLVKHLQQNSQSKDILISYIDQLENENSLVRVFIGLQDSDLRHKILMRINKPKNIYKLIKEESSKELHSELIDKLDDVEFLKKCASKLHSRPIRRLAQEKLQKMGIGPDGEEEQEKKIHSLWSRIQDFRQNPSWDKAQDFLEEVNPTHWLNFDPQGLHKLKGQFNEFHAALSRQHDEYQKIESDIKSIFSDIAAQFGPASDFISNFSFKRDFKIPAHFIQQLKERWESTNISLLPEVLRNKYEKLYEQIIAQYEQQKMEAAQLHAREGEGPSRSPGKKSLSAELKAKISELKLLNQQFIAKSGGSLEALEKKFNIVMEEIKKQGLNLDLLEKSSEQYRKIIQDAKTFLNNYDKAKEEQKKNHEIEYKEKIKELLRSMQEFAAQEDLPNWKQVTAPLLKEWDKVEILFPKLAKHSRDTFHQYYQSIVDKKKRIWEDHEYERWANTAKFEKIIAALKEKIESTNLEKTGDFLRQVSKDIKSVGPLSKEKSGALWKDYKKLYSELLNLGLAQKNQFIESLSQVVKHTGELLPRDIKNKVSEIKNLQSLWNHIGGLPHKEDEKLYKKFRELCDYFFDPNNEINKKFTEAREQNLKDKNALIRRAQKLAKQKNSSYSARSKEFVELQNEWRRIGPTPHKEGQDLWQNFQQVCNGFFEEYEKHKQENLTQKLNILEEVQKSLEENKTARIPQLNEKLKVYQEAWQAIGSIPQDQSSKVEAQFKNLIDAFFQEEKNEKQKLADLKLEALQKKLALSQEAVDILVSNPQPTEEKQQQLQEIFTNYEQIEKTFPEQEKILSELLLKNMREIYPAHRKALELQDAKTLQRLQEQLEDTIVRFVILNRLAFAENTIDMPIANYSKAKELKMGLDYNRKLLITGDRQRTEQNIIKEVLELMGQWKKLVIPLTSQISTAASTTDSSPANPRLATTPLASLLVDFFRLSLSLVLQLVGEKLKLK